MTFSEECVISRPPTGQGLCHGQESATIEPHLCPSWKEEEEAPQPPQEGGAVPGAREGEHRPAPAGAQNATPAATEPPQEQREETTLTPIPFQSITPVYLQDLQTDKLNEFHNSEVQRQRSLNGL